MADDDHTPISVQQAKDLFASWKAAPALVLAVSGGPDSLALMWLAARWRRALPRGPRLIAVTVDHGLRPEAAREARDVKRLAQTLEVPHRTLRWTGTKPKTGLPAAARAANAVHEVCEIGATLLRREQRSRKKNRPHDRSSLHSMTILTRRLARGRR